MSFDIKGAIAGGMQVITHGHHAVIGAVGGCVVGHHLAKKHAQEQGAAKAQAAQLHRRRVTFSETAPQVALVCAKGR